MKTNLTLFILLLAATPALAETRVSIGVHLGGRYGYYPPPPAYVYQPPCPGPGYVWVPGYWYGPGPRYSWRAGYWTPHRSRGWHGHRAYDPWGVTIRYRRDEDRHWKGGHHRNHHRSGRHGSRRWKD